MRDFTLVAYRNYLKAISDSGIPFMRFREFMELENQPNSFCLIRHDIDRRPANALQMAQMEAEMGIAATYYFRTKSGVYKEHIVSAIHALGHEIGYHYESLSDTDGDISKAIKDFERNLEMMRITVPVSTCSMHGRPLKPHDNRDMWREQSNHRYLKEQLGIVGEAYLDIDYTDIAYINDTGRNWTSGVSNRRDKVDSLVSSDFQSGSALMQAFLDGQYNKICFQIHPERWSDNAIEWIVQLTTDGSANLIKRIIR
jgi:hypothetical protein